MQDGAASAAIGAYAMQSIDHAVLVWAKPVRRYRMLLRLNQFEVLHCSYEVDDGFAANPWDRCGPEVLGLRRSVADSSTAPVSDWQVGPAPTSSR
ncbi:hypothetical protein GCM10009830_04030 [Glycomyces endophyticus]|uniref:Uncharacterized protein n=1 Tax=Glycomyces endophyticus TaxID=480996 RepID=A0ABN2FY93_9ACTN